MALDWVAQNSNFQCFERVDFKFDSILLKEDVDASTGYSHLNLVTSMEMSGTNGTVCLYNALNY